MFLKRYRRVPVTVIKRNQDDRSVKEEIGFFATTFFKNKTF
jgi:hypothetical protein